MPGKHGPFPEHKIVLVKEDVLEQVVDDYLQLQGYFTMHNIRFRPSSSHPDFVSTSDSVYSDLDVLGVNPRLRGPSRVVAVSCKSWQSGFNPTSKLAELRGEKKGGKRQTWRMFRELWSPKWSLAFVDRIEELTGQREFEYRIAVTKLIGSGTAEAWNHDATITSNLPKCPISLMTMEGMWREVVDALGTTPAASEIGRLAQLLKASGVA